MKHLLLAVAVVLALAAPAAAAHTSSGPTIVYNDLYLQLIAAYPSGIVSNPCEAVLFVTGELGLCNPILRTSFFYPDGTFGATPWYEDASSPTGWSIAPSACDVLTDADWMAWWDWLDYGSPLSDEQIALYSQCFGF